MGVAVDLIVIYIIMAVMISPALTSMGVVPIAANLFILYYTIVGLITPPVCVATYAASSIAESKPFRTGFNAVRLGFVALVIPFVFCYKPELLFQGGSVLSTLVSTFFTLSAIIALSGAFEKFFFRFTLKIPEMLYLCVSGVFMLLKPLSFNIAGFLLFAAFILFNLFRKRFFRYAEEPGNRAADRKGLVWKKSWLCTTARTPAVSFTIYYPHVSKRRNFPQRCSCLKLSGIPSRAFRVVSASANTGAAWSIWQIM